MALQDDADLIRQAQKADRTPVVGALHGIPMALKDLVNVADITSTFGSPPLRYNIPTTDDVVAARIRQAGAMSQEF